MQRQVEVVRSHFEAGNYEEALKRARDVLTSDALTDAQRMEVNRWAGLSAFNLDDLKTASEFLTQVLFLNPDCVLDPFAVPPLAIAFFEELRKKNEEALNLVRRQLAEQGTGKPSEAAASSAPPPLAKSAPPLTRAFLFAPFGVAQFEQQRPAEGLTLALVQGLLAASSVVGFWGLESLYRTQTLTLDDRVGSEVTYTVRGIPESRRDEARGFRALKDVSAVAFYVAYAAGVADAFLQRAPPPPDSIALRWSLLPLSGGAGAELSFEF
jgi:hypothetical protein